MNIENLDYIWNKFQKISNFLGKEDDWKETNTTVDKEVLINYFKDFKIMYF